MTALEAVDAVATAPARSVPRNGWLVVAAKEFADAQVSDLGEGRLMGAAIEAARADASTGEMMAVLKTALGWAAPHES